MDHHDGIATLLQIPDSTEKSLALKSKHIQPYHLRTALQDSDPHIRKLAALHPKLTKELVREILHSEDKDLRHAVLTRPDLDEEELEIVHNHPEHALEVARHPRTTEALRQKALEHDNVPEGVKKEHQRAMAKSIGHITFPKLGEGQVYTKPMHVTKEQGKARIDYSGSPPSMASNTGGWLSNSVNDNPDKGLSPSNRTMTSVSYPASPKRMHATEDHEAQHSVFARIGQKYGEMAQRRVVATTLSQLPEHYREHIKNLFQATNTGGDILVDPEETIAYLNTYLQDPNHRSKVHAKLGWHDIDTQRRSQETARKAWNHLRRIGHELRPEDVGIDPKDQRKRIDNWLKTLAKRESMPSDQLGFSVSFLEIIAICEFLTHRTVDSATLRQHIRMADGDGQTGILQAFGLNTPEGRKAFEGVKMLRLHKAEDLLKEPKSILEVIDGDIAEKIRDAYKRKEVQSIALGGKHSSGSYIAKDKDGNDWLLKPGSGKKSPAAGVDETKGSQSRREAVFSRMAKEMGIDEVQPAGLLQIDGKEVAAIKMWPMNWVNLHRTLSQDSSLPRRALEPYRRNGTLFKWSVLDAITANVDRHGNNIMVGPANEGNKIGLIDHGSTMAGPGFDPGHDDNTFVPYYLRVWAGTNFHNMPPDVQLKQMPTIHGEVDQKLREWVEALNEEELAHIITMCGMDSAPALARLAKLKNLMSLTPNASEATNRFWLANDGRALPTS